MKINVHYGAGNRIAIVSFTVIFKCYVYLKIYYCILKVAVVWSVFSSCLKGSKELLNTVKVEHVHPLHIN